MREFKEDKDQILDFNSEKSSKSEKSLQKNITTSPLYKKDSKERWEKLHDLNKVKNQAREILKNSIITKNEKELSKCTFAPKLTEKSLEMANNQKIPFLERNEKWQKLKEKKKKYKNEKQKERKLYFCTFSPKKLPKSNLAKKQKISLKSKPSAKKFVERQEFSRKIKDEKKNYFKFIKKKK